MAYEILAPQTAAGNSKEVHVGGAGNFSTAETTNTVRCKFPCTVSLSPNPNALETATVERPNHAGAAGSWMDYIPQGGAGTALTLSDQQNTITFFGPVVFRVAKGVTTPLCGIYLSTDDNP